jgi:hypothetical protein
MFLLNLTGENALIYAFFFGFSYQQPPSLKEKSSGISQIQIESVVANLNRL